ncbi:AbrB/MazE/SpoVT family DNA-binding domain-containing protein [uncultured Microbacterium sp.]|uniref:AbrB/MazE/SpoVT family DNA-binding domain-containing protein n=1 Tax=uncultured Microbacterium sp. TaxID=191216 RepID=UPI0026025F4C|nr:AbrB/MazE/SpoVT family DNA-binding domain-containing protein [uncultured Microbacterium sp.]
MKLNSKGQVTIPAELRHRHGLVEGDEIEVVEDGATLRIVHTQSDLSPAERVVARMRGRATSQTRRMSTDEIMALLRDE